ncbi:hypothetical protein RDWZM_003530 [Blomia tropicalis]|uniref:Peptidase S1 domain-containing protein n=1 Tax=Blomia tropicalis TaxID=40697 RepID=A0A9Q0MFG0_BLOTA|nr:hypothetical protein RDWZM_003530 [Blomia tropicalis]
MIILGTWFVVTVSLVTLLDAKCEQKNVKCGINKLSIYSGDPSGEVVNNHANPWMAFLALTYYNRNGKLEGYTCSGTLINDEWILTSANCLSVGKNNNFAYGIAILGTNQVSYKNMSKHKVIITFNQKNFKPESYENDIALLKLPKKLDFNDIGNYIRPICLTYQYAELENCSATGWAQLRPLSRQLVHIRESIIPLDDCRKDGLLGTNALCGKNRFQANCYNDYGGPLQCVEKKSKAWTIVGVVPYGLACSGIHSFPRVLKYLDWIESVMDKK